MFSKHIHITRPFTLIELLVVISIISLLISILLPALGQARKTANAIKCGTMLRAMGTANVIYANDFKDWAAPNWWRETPSSSKRYYFFTNSGIHDRLNITTADWGARWNHHFACPEAGALTHATRSNSDGILIRYVYGHNYHVGKLRGSDASWSTGTISGVKISELITPSVDINLGDGITQQIGYPDINQYVNESTDAPSGKNVPAFRHTGETMNQLFYDQHVKRISRTATLSQVASWFY